MEILQNNDTGKVREAVGVFDNPDDLNEAIAELEATAFPRGTLSVLGSHQAIKKKFGRGDVVPEILEGNPDTPRREPVRPEERGLGAAALVGGGAYVGAAAAAIGAGAISIPAIVTAAAIAGGSGAILAKIIDNRYRERIKKQVDKGGLILWVQTPEPAQEELACEILQKHHARHVHVHAIK